MAPNALVGRVGEVAALRRLLVAPQTRLLTVTGPPGVGKTRLATAAAAAVVPHFADGVVFVDLTTVRDPGLVAGEVLGAIGAGESVTLDSSDVPARLRRALAGRDILIVLDNFEHVLPAGPVIAEVLAGSARARMLVTSRECLHLQAEREIPVQPLGLPGSGDDLDRIAAAPAVAMLVQGVRAFDPAFDVTEENRAALAEICARLDGLPLALELAAARLRLFTPGELTFRLRHRMSVLTSIVLDMPDRHRTLRAALTWSHDLLTPLERALFRRFSVFVGAATLDGVRHICDVSDGSDVLTAVASLVDKNLLQRRTRRGEVGEFVMLESLREFAAELLVAHDEERLTRHRYACYYAGIAARNEARIGTAQERAAIAEVGLEQGNLRAALACATAAGRVAQALQLAAALGWYSYTHGRLGEGTATIDSAIAAADLASEPVPDDPLAAALMISSVVALSCGELDRVQERLGRCRRINERIGDSRRTAITSAFLGHLARARGDYDAAVRHHERAADLHGRLGNGPGVAWSGYDLGLLARRRGQLDTAARHLRSALPRFRESDYVWAIGCTAWALATVELRRDRPDDAAGLLTEALDSFAAADDDRGLAQSLEAVASVARLRGRPDDAARLLGAAAARRERLAAPLPEEDHEDHAAVERRVRHDLGADGADRARCAGRGLSRGEVLGLARRVLAGPAQGGPVRSAGGLTPRERQVADLVARGRTNRQIGRVLGIAEKTAEVHVHHIIRKLDARSRAEVAAWVGARGGPA